MKKIIIFFVIVIAILGTIWYIINQKKIETRTIKEANEKYEIAKEREITGVELASIINKAIDNNEKNAVQKDSNGIYIDNEINSINIQIKFIESEETINMERIFAKGTKQFLQYYSYQNFKCNKIEYHKSTKLVKALYMEEI